MNIVFGITGNLGTGKSSLAIDLQSYWSTQGTELKIIELDDVRRYALWKSTQLHHIQLRKDLAKELNILSEGEFHWLNRKAFTELIFSSKEMLDNYANIATPIFMYDIQKDISSENLDAVIVWAHLLEENYEQLLTSSVILTDCSSETIINRLMPSIMKGDDLSYQELKKRMDLQSNTQNCLNLAKEKNIHCILQNTESHVENDGLSQLLETIQTNHKPMSNSNNQVYDTTLPFCKFKIPMNGGRVIWEVTNECNYGCKYCIFASTGRKPEGELSTPEIFSALNQLKNEGFTHIKFTGGEPFLREDMIDILKEADRLGFQFDISTNASKLSEKIVNEFSKLNSEYIHVSLDGHDLPSHESVRGKKSFNPTVNGLKLLCLKGIKIRIGCVIHSENENHLEELIQFCSSLGIRHIVFSMMEPVGRLRDKTKGLATRAIHELAATIEELKQKYPYMLISHNLQSMQKISIDSIKRKKPSNSVSACPAGERFLFINSVGDVSPCTWTSEHRSEYIGGKINKQSLSEILNSAPIQNMRNLANKLIEKAICPMADLKTTETVETAIKAADIQNHDVKFGKFAPIYRFTTENIKYLPLLDINNKKVLTIGGSYDHAIDLALLNAISVTNLDLNICAKYYAQLKRTALASLNYEEFKNFLGNSKNSFNFNVYENIKRLLPLDCSIFFDELYKQVANDGFKLLHSSYLHNRDNQDFLNHTIYLESESKYVEAQEKLKKSDFIWIEQSILNHEDIGMFDIVLLSNIADYSHRMFETTNHAEEFRNKVVLPWLEHIEPGGKIMFAYVFDSPNILGSDKRNCFNDKNIRTNLYENLNGYKYYEVTLDSSIKNALTDSICILERIK
jgi:MoaA/NifB/PqqE/SkfB family radical SAM enzyme/dephospho-CoA kinase